MTAADGLAAWAQRAGQRSPDGPQAGGLRFAFYGRVSTEDWQDPVTSRARQREQGRYLGGRPPYGYRLGDAGPHPNKVHAAWGRRAHRLEPHPETAHVVKWICCSLSPPARSAADVPTAGPTSDARPPSRRRSATCARSRPRGPKPEGGV